MGSTGWSTTARWEGCTRATAGPRIDHVLRDVEEQHGLFREHSNELIDRTRTATNFSYRPVLLPDGTVVKEQIASVGEVWERLDEALESVKRYREVPATRRVKVRDEAGRPVPALDADGSPQKDKRGKPVYLTKEVPNPSAGKKVPVALRKDTVVLVEELFQLDPEFTGPAAEITPEKREEIQRLYEVWLAELQEQYGTENLLFVSEHWDETSPHVTAFCIPKVDRGDGTAELNSKLVLTGKKKPTKDEASAAYTAKHDRLRESLRQNGYEATFERLTPRDEKGNPGKGTDLSGFKRAAQRATAELREQLEEKGSVLEAKATKIEEREQALDQRKQRLDDLTLEMVKKMKDFTAWAEKTQEELESEREDLGQIRGDLSDRESAAEQAIAEALELQGRAKGAFDFLKEVSGYLPKNAARNLDKMGVLIGVDAERLEKLSELGNKPKQRPGDPQYT